MERQIYPIGQQDFKTIRERGQVYVDKTRFIPLLLENQFYFLSRPRRFGKSLLLSTLEQFFLGRKELFKGLAVESYPWDWEQYPVIRISLGQGAFSKEDGLRTRIESFLTQTEKQYGIIPEWTTTSERLESLIRNLHEKTKKKVVILIDEYEKPLLDSYETPMFEQNMVELAEFYSAFKDNSEHIFFLLITGVTRFGKLNIFSGLNNLRDISLSSHFDAICGITTEELKEYLQSGIEIFAKENELTIEEAFEELKKYYDGYHFSLNLKDIYNPWSLLNCLAESRPVSEWFASGSPKYLLKILRKKEYDLEGLLGSKVSEARLTGSGVDIMDPTALLYQSGYLTIKSYDRRDQLYGIGLPNLEVRTALLEHIIPFFLGKEKTFEKTDIISLYNYLEKGDADAMMKWLAAYFSKVSYLSKIRFEKDFQFVVLSIFLLIKDFRQVHCEYSMSSGRTDLVVEAGEYVYVFEFKIGDEPGKAMEQINSRRYDLPWNAVGRKVIKIGAAFSVENNGILRYVIE